MSISISLPIRYRTHSTCGVLQQFTKSIATLSQTLHTRNVDGQPMHQTCKRSVNHGGLCDCLLHPEFSPNPHTEVLEHINTNEMASTSSDPMELGQAVDWAPVSANPAYYLHRLAVTCLICMAAYFYQFSLCVAAMVIWRFCGHSSVSLTSTFIIMFTFALAPVILPVTCAMNICKVVITMQFMHIHILSSQVRPRVGAVKAPPAICFGANSNTKDCLMWHDAVERNASPSSRNALNME